MANAASLGRGGQFGLAAMRLVAAGLFAVFMLNLMAEAVNAKPSPGSYQNGFVAACRNRGGTTKRVGSRIVKCTYSGGTVTCDFNTDPPTCWTGAVGSEDSPVFDNEGGVLAQDDSTTGGTDTTGGTPTMGGGTYTTGGTSATGGTYSTGGAYQSGGTIVLIEDNEQP